VIFAYLDELLMRVTHDTIRTEAQNKDFPRDVSGFDASRASDYLGDLVNLSKSFANHDDRFAEAVKEFSINPSGQRFLSASRQRQPFLSAPVKQQPLPAKSPPKPQSKAPQLQVEDHYESEEGDGDPQPVVKVTPKSTALLAGSDSDQFGDRFSDVDDEKSDIVEIVSFEHEEEEEDNVNGESDREKNPTRDSDDIDDLETIFDEFDA
jgi:hypothetical protein